MLPENFFYLSIIVLGIVFSLILQFKFRKFQTELPKEWEKSMSARNFLLSVSFLSVFLILVFLSECISQYLAKHNIYNSFVFSIYFTLAVPFLFGFLFIYTQTTWKRLAYILLYLILIAYLVQGGYFHPRSNLDGFSSLLIYSIHFFAALLHLTDLLMKPKSEHFKFQLKINLAILFSMLLSLILNSGYWFNSISYEYFSEMIFHLQYFNLILFYSTLTGIFIFEILKLRRL